jgi:hypothetical protein
MHGVHVQDRYMGDVPDHIQRTINKLDNMYIGFQRFQHPKFQKFRNLVAVGRSESTLVYDEDIAHSQCTYTSGDTVRFEMKAIPIRKPSHRGALGVPKGVTLDNLQAYVQRTKDRATAVAQEACQHLQERFPPNKLKKCACVSSMLMTERQAKQTDKLLPKNCHGTEPKT